MADVSIRLTVAGDAEIVFNLTVPQAVRLVEALAREMADTVSAARRAGTEQLPTGVTGLSTWPPSRGS